MIRRWAPRWARKSVLYLDGPAAVPSHYFFSPGSSLRPAPMFAVGRVLRQPRGLVLQKNKRFALVEYFDGHRDRLALLGPHSSPLRGRGVRFGEIVEAAAHKKKTFKPTDNDLAKVALNKMLNKPMQHVELIVDGEIQQYSPAFIASGLYMASSARDAARIFSQTVAINKNNEM